MPGSSILPSLLTPLAERGIDITRQLQQILNEVNRRLDEQYNFSSPTWFPNILPVGTFYTELEHRTIGAQQYVWERGSMDGLYYRIRPRTNWPMRWFVQAQYKSEEQAREHWNGFIALMEAREGIPALMNQGAQPGNTGGLAITVRCRQCKSLNDESAKYCNQCGSQL
jgi:hypothetical protein